MQPWATQGGVVAQLSFLAVTESENVKSWKFEKPTRLKFIAGKRHQVNKQIVLGTAMSERL
jgi:hypothetical protein